MTQATASGHRFYWNVRYGNWAIIQEEVRRFYTLQYVENLVDGRCTDYQPTTGTCERLAAYLDSLEAE